LANPVNHTDRHGLDCDPDEDDGDCQQVPDPGGYTCPGGQYFDPTTGDCENDQNPNQPDPGPPPGGGAPAPLSCNFASAQTNSTPSLQHFQLASTSFFYWGAAIAINFTASGGSGNYSFSVTQLIQSQGTVTYDNTTLDDSAPLHPDPPFPNQVQQNGSNLTFTDAPGIGIASTAGVLLTAASVTWNAITTVILTDGNTSIECPVVYWSAVVNVQASPGNVVLSGGSIVTSVSP
jgi:hypothetical protein